MDQTKIRIAIGILDLAERYGPAMVAAVKGVFGGDLTPEENAETLRIWQDNEDRARRNAGLPPVA